MNTVTRTPRPGKARPDTYQIITDRIVSLLESGVVPWRQPWTGDGEPRNLSSGKAYRGVNTFLLGCSSYSSCYWLTYKQARERGGHVRKGERGTPVVFWKWFKTGDKATDAETTTETTPDKRPPCMVRYYTVFNVTQCDGLEYPTPETRDTSATIPACEAIVDNMPHRPTIDHGGDRACYAPITDVVSMPDRARFNSDETYYETLFHELTHSTAHKTRCARKSESKDWHPFGSQDYSKEELVAEIGSAYLCNISGIVDRTIDSSAAYIAGWLKRLRDDKRCVITAAAQAQKASDYILDVAPHDKGGAV